LWAKERYAVFSQTSAEVAINVFGTNHYVPILRWKQAERFALHRLQNEDKGRMTPLIEITPKSFRAKKRTKGEPQEASPETLVVAGSQDLTPDPGSVLRRHAKEVLRFWGYSPFFLDLGHLEGIVSSINGNRHALAYFAEIGRSYRLRVVPVTALDRPPQYRDAVATVVGTDRNGACVRVAASEVMADTFAERVREYLSQLNVAVVDTDLLLDYGVFDPDAPAIHDLLARVPQVKRWRSLILARGAFPKDLQGFKPGAHKIGIRPVIPSSTSERSWAYSN
jgi:hypothetical protein